MAKLYPYVGPARISEQARHQPAGFEVRSLDGLRGWLGRHGARHGEVTATFVIDRAGTLRVADRHAEHVACAGGGPVRSAGEMTFSAPGDPIEVTYVSNQSTGFCPEPASWAEVQTALDQFGLAHPGRFSEAFQFRRCPSCEQTNLIKDEIFVCDTCEAELPRTWNFEA